MLENLIWENLIWQDLVFMIAGFIFTIALIPTLRSKKEKPKKSTCLTTGGTLLVLSVCYATLGLWLAFGSTLLNATIWLTILAQKIFYDKTKSASMK